MIHTIFILNPSGNVIFDRNYQGVGSRVVCEFFWKEKTNPESQGRLPPVIRKGKIFIFHIERHGYYFLATTMTETAPLLVLEFLHRMVDIFEEYFTVITENSLKDNFTTLYQLLDEMIDGGFPCTTESNILKEMVMLPNMLNKTFSALTGQQNTPDQISTNLTGIPWRKANIKYSHNEVYFDIIEEIDVVFEAGGTIAYNEINGEILCNCRLSGMPDLLLTFDDPTLLDDCSFHPCVRYNRFQTEKVLSFIPPDGQFKLMGFKISRPTPSIPLNIRPNISFSTNSGHIQIAVSSKNVGNTKVAEEVAITFTVPKTTSTHTLSATYGQIHYDETTKTVRWDIGRIPSGATPTMTGNLALSSVPGYSPSNPDLLVEFKMTTFSVSGLKVQSVAIMNERYKPYKGVRSITKAGKVQVRT